MTAQREQTKQRTYANSRQARLVELLRAQGYQSIFDLSAGIGVSPATIRRDLRILAGQQVVQLSHGGAQLASRMQVESNFDARTYEHQLEKQQIGKLAATMVSPGAVIGIDAGTTTLEVARSLPDIPLTVVTYSLPVVNALSQRSRCTLIVLGGVFHSESLSFSGPQVLAMLRGLRLNKLFLSSSGLHLTDGLSSSYLFDAEVKRALIDCSREVILCMDSSKLEQTFLTLFATMDDVDTLVTDWKITPEALEQIEQRGLQVTKAPVP